MANNVSSSTNNKHAEAVEFVKETLYNNHKIPITNIKKQSKTGYDLFFVKDNKEYYIIVVKVKFEKENSKSTLNAINAKKWDFINQNNEVYRSKCSLKKSGFVQ